MSKTFKLFLICFLSISVLSFKNRLRQGPGEIVPPGQANATLPQLPPSENGNATQLPPLPPQEANATKIEEQPAQEGNATQPQLPAEQILNISESAAAPSEQVVGGAGGIPPQAPISAGMPSTTVVNVDSPVVSVSGEAIAALQSDLIKIGVLVENEGVKADEVLTQNQQKVNDLIAKLKELGLKDENILNLGLMINPKNKLKPNESEEQVNQTDMASKNETKKSDNQLFATSQLEIQVNDIAQAGKILDLINSQNFETKYIDYNYLPDSLNYAINTLTENALADAERRALGSITKTGEQLGQLLNRNVEIDKDYQNYLNENVENKPRIKVIKVTVYVTYALQGVQAPATQPGEEQKPAEDQAVLERRRRRKPARNATLPIGAGNATAPLEPAGNATAPLEPAGNATAPLAPAGNATAPEAPAGNATQI